jgi:hypothetical protein
MRENLVIKKEFLNLKEGDIISIAVGCDRKIYFSVLNRTRKARFYGNVKGVWSAENSYLKAKKAGEPEFLIVDEFAGEKIIIEFGYLPTNTEPHPTDVLKCVGNYMSENDWIDKIIIDLKSVGVL